MLSTRIETNNEIYETKYNLIQIELTGYCNMNCKHCRAKNEPRVYFSETNFNILLDLIKLEQGEDFKLTFSGGEPFLHNKLLKFVGKAKENGVKSLVITTNGSLVKKEHLDYINNLKFDNFILQVSLDSLNSKEHDNFRGFKGAFKLCDNLLESLKLYSNINSSIRMTISRDTIPEMEKMVEYALSKGCKIIGFGSIIPFGRAANCVMSLDSKTKLIFLSEVIRLNLKYKGKIEVVTEDPLKSIVENSPWKVKNDNLNDGMIFGGCTAGIDSINIQSNGYVTPCSMIKEKILNLDECANVMDFINRYEKSKLVKKLFERKFSGKCGLCKNKYICGGCRASAKGRTNDLFGTDESCWLKNDDL